MRQNMNYTSFINSFLQINIFYISIIRIISSRNVRVLLPLNFPRVRLEKVWRWNELLSSSYSGYCPSLLFLVNSVVKWGASRSLPFPLARRACLPNWLIYRATAAMKCICWLSCKIIVSGCVFHRQHTNCANCN